MTSRTMIFFFLEGWRVVKYSWGVRSGEESRILWEVEADRSVGVCLQGWVGREGDLTCRVCVPPRVAAGERK